MLRGVLSHTQFFQKWSAQAQRDPFAVSLQSSGPYPATPHRIVGPRVPHARNPGRWVRLLEAQRDWGSEEGCAGL